jgi:iron complex outermembrane receptor protein
MPAKGNEVTMHMLLVLAALLVCGPAITAAAESTIITGTVRDERSQPIAGATVQLRDARRGTYTDVRGRYRLSATVGDTLHLSITSIGTRGVDTAIVVRAGVELNVTLVTTGVLARGIDVASFRAAIDDPVTQSVVSAVDLRTIAIGQDPQYLLERTVPSIIATSESGTGVTNYGSFRLRGIDQTRVNITLDGTPLNDMIDQGVFFSNIGDLMNGMRSVSVQRGVGSSSNGTASFAGSVDMEGADLAAPDPSAEVQLLGGSYATMRASAAVGTGRTDANVSMFARFTSLSSDGYRHHTGTATNSLYVTGAWFGASDVVRATAVWGRARNELGYYAVPKTLADADPRTNLNDSADTDDFGQYLLQLQHSHAFGADATLTTTLYAGGAGGDYFTGFRDTAGALTLLNYPLENRHYGVMSALEGHDVVDGLDLTAGLHAYTFRRRNWETVMPEAARPSYEDSTTKDELSGFLRLRYDAGAVDLYGDVQVRHVNMTFRPDGRSSVTADGIPVQTWTFVNPRIGARYRLSDEADLYASLGATGREPTRFDLLGSTQINDANINVLLTPGTVRPEYVTDVELGMRWGGPFGRINVNAFAMFFRDEIAPIGPFIEQQFVQLRKNVPQSRRLGVELEAFVRFTSWLSVDLVATVTDAVVDEYAPDNLGTDTVFTGVRPILTPPVQAAWTLRWEPVDAIDVELAGRYVSASFTDLSNADGLELPSFVQTDARLWWTFAGQHRLGVLVNNITDAFIVTNGGSAFDGTSTVPTYFVQAGRNLAVMLNLRF